MLRIYVDADACPVKDEVYRVALRCELPVFVVANTWMQTPERGQVELVVVDDGFDAADDWIVEHAERGDIVITSDIPLAARCLEKSARVLGPKGNAFTEDGIGAALAQRELLASLREMGENTGGPAAMQPQDRSRFLQELDKVIQQVRRRGR